MAKTYKVSAEFLRSIVYAADTDGDGVVDRKEFAAFMLDKELTLRAVFGSMRKVNLASLATSQP